MVAWYRHRCCMLVVASLVVGWIGGCYSPTSSIEGGQDSTALVFESGDNGWIEQQGYAQLSLEQSAQRWAELKRSYGSTYHYTTSVTSVFGYGQKSSVFVRNDSVVLVWINYVHTNQTTGSSVTDSSTYLRGAAVQAAGYGTVDALYAYARDSVLTKERVDNRVDLELFENGLLRSCTWTPLNCVDDW